MYEEHKCLVVDFCNTGGIQQNAESTGFFFGGDRAIIKVLYL
jgi:hypothetical protein